MNIKGELIAPSYILIINLKCKIMSKMGWIAQMIEDGSYEHFKQSYENSLKNNNKFFKFEGANCDITLGKHICKFVDDYLIKQHKLAKEYEELITKGF